MLCTWWREAPDSDSHLWRVPPEAGAAAQEEDSTWREKYDGWREEPQVYSRMVSYTKPVNRRGGGGGRERRKARRKLERSERKRARKPDAQSPVGCAVM